MKITCPQCGANGNLPDHEIPEEGRFLSCPRCKHGFDVKKPRATSNEYLLDSCPACAYSTFGEERFSTCPKCGVEIKIFVERQREEMTRAREHELLTKKFSRDTILSSPPPPTPGSKYLSPASLSDSNGSALSDMIENLHPVNLVGWGGALVSAVILVLAALGMFDYYGTDIQAALAEQRDEPVSAWYVFMHYGLKPWVMALYGGSLLAVSILFLQRKAQARRAMGWLLYAFIIYIPVSMIIRFILWWIAPIPHTWGGYATEIFNIFFMSILFGVPLYLLINFLEDRRIRSVVKL